MTDVELPLFPLHTVLFPGAAMPLHVFEDRYRTMISDIVQGNGALGIIAIRAGMEVGGRADTHTIGCLATLDDVQRHDDGTMDVIVTGKTRFRIDERLDDDPYPRADVSLLQDGPGSIDPNAIVDARAAVAAYLDSLGKSQGARLASPAAPDDVVGASCAFAAALQVDLVERQRLLSLDAPERLAAVIDIARREALLLERIGPPVGRPTGAYSPN